MLISEMITHLENRKKEVGDVKVIISTDDDDCRVDSVTSMSFSDGNKLVRINSGTWVVPQRYCKP